MRTFMMTVWRALSVAGVAVILAGCATAAQRQYQAMATNNRSAVQEFQACAETVYNSPDYAPLRRHVPFTVTDATLEQLSDNSFATDNEIRLILEAHPKIQACRQQALDRVTQSTPSLAAILATLYAKGDDSLIQLISKRRTWGEHTRQVRDLAIEGRSELTAEAQRVTAELQQSHEAELAQRQAAAQAATAALAQYAQTQQIIANMNRPTFTNCLRMGYQGNMLNCTTW
jgi:hypothetical protein